MSSSMYTYRYTPKGSSAQEIITWIKKQNNKSESLSLLILKAINEYGNQDLVDVLKDNFLNSDSQTINKNTTSNNSNNKSLNNSKQPKETNTTISQTESNTDNSNTPSPASSQSSQNHSDKKPSKPDFGFLSK